MDEAEALVYFYSGLKALVLVLDSAGVPMPIPTPAKRKGSSAGRSVLPEETGVPGQGQRLGFCSPFL